VDARKRLSGSFALPWTCVSFGELRRCSKFPLKFWSPVAELAQLRRGPGVAAAGSAAAGVTGEPPVATWASECVIEANCQTACARGTTNVAKLPARFSNDFWPPIDRGGAGEMVGCRSATGEPPVATKRTNLRQARSAYFSEEDRFPEGDRFFWGSLVAAATAWREAGSVGSGRTD
jgi:hypothetical protein